MPENRSHEEIIIDLTNEDYAAYESTKVKMALAKIAKLYTIEQRCKEKTPQERYQIRQEQARPLIEDIKLWIDKNLEQSTPHQLLHKAISYTLNK